MSFVVQIFYAYRIRVFTQSYIVPSLVALVKIPFSCTMNDFLFCVVGFMSIRRRNCRRCDWSPNLAFLIQCFDPGDKHINWCMCLLVSFGTFLNNPNLQVWNGCSAACDLLIAISMTYSVCLRFCIFCTF